MEQNLVFIAATGAIVVIVLTIALVRFWKRARSYELRFQPIIDADQELGRVKAEQAKVVTETDQLRNTYKEKRKIFDALVRQAAIYDEEIELAELGFYKPHFNYDTSEEYKKQIVEIRARQKEMLSEKTAITCRTEWTVEGSKAKGRTMSNRAIRLAARAFNNECDAAIAQVAWNNAERMEARIKKAFEAINKLNESITVEISPAYLDLKVKELELAHEYQEKKRQEKEEQAEIRRQMREEAKLQQEVEKTLREEERYKALLEAARKEAAGAADAKRRELEKKIVTLEQELADAHEKSEHAVSMAQQTRVGHVYIISNRGSFGTDIFKIGMTRRLDPYDRVKELGDASVPFGFDVHAIIYSKDAPTLENALHRAFDGERVNLANTRKEFFRVGLDRIRAAVRSQVPDAEFYEQAEAREYKETVALQVQRDQATARQQMGQQFPEEL